MADIQHPRGYRVALIVQGVAAIVFGLILLFWPGPSLIAFVYLFTAWVLLHGILDLVGWFTAAKPDRSALMLVTGVLSLLAGIAFLIIPQAAAAALGIAVIAILAAWIFLLGAVQIALAFQLRRIGLRFWWVLLITGVIGLAAGVVVLLNPAASVLSVLWLVAAFTLADGVFLLIQGIRRTS